VSDPTADDQESIPWLKEQWTKDASHIFYHYTTLDGLLGIIGKGKLWATHVRYLNDTSEFKIGVDAVTWMLIEKLNHVGNSSIEIEFYKGLIRQMTLPIYVASFSAESSGDDLSQWRAYGGHHTGFCLGFSRQYLIEIGMNFLGLGKENGWSQMPIAPFVECHYFDDKDAEGFRTLVDRQFDKHIQGQLGKLSPWAPSLLARYAAELKHRSFAAEKEWRIALMRDNDDAFEGLEFRKSSSLAVPYVPISLAWPGQRIKVERIIIGPTPHKAEAKLSVELLLKRYTVDCGEIAESSIPFRNW
jgi:hypothetical protein